MAKMYLMSGCSGVGKTTFAKKFAEENNLLYLGTDEFYALINGDEIIHENSFEVWIALYQAIHAAEMNGRDCIVDTNALTVVHRDQFLDWFPTFEHHLFFISANEDLRRANNLSRRRQVPEEKMNEMSVRVQYPYWEKLDVRWQSLTWYANIGNKLQLVERRKRR